MRCPHCGGLNPDTSKYCIRCGRTFAPQQNAAQPAQRPVYPPRATTSSQQSRPVYPPPSQPRPSVTPQPSRPTVYPPTTSSTAQPASTPPVAPTRTARPAPKPFRKEQEAWPTEPPIPAAPEPPAPFPPHTVAHLKQLIGGALDYTVTDENTNSRIKKVVRILYRRCAPWQQVATLLKALNDLDDKKFDTIIIQGMYNQERTTYEFTNGQLIFDRNVRLGSQTQKRYQIETDNGYVMEAVRIVVSE